MALTHVQDAQSFLSRLASSNQVAIIGFFNESSADSRNALPEFERFCAEHPDQPTFLVDIAATQGLHTRFGVANTVPTVLYVKGERVLKEVIGAQTASFYGRAFLNGSSGLHQATQVAGRS